MTAALNALASSALAGVLALDTVQALQFLLARPAFVGPLLGWLNGCLLDGAQVGILLELLYIDVIPVGGVVPPNGAAAAAVGVLAHSAAGLPPSLGFFAGAAAGAGFSPFEARIRAARSGWNALVTAQVEAGDFNIGRWLARAMALEAGALAAYVACCTGLCALAALTPRLELAYPAADFAFSLMPLLGLSGLYFRFRTQARKKQGK